VAILTGQITGLGSLSACLKWNTLYSKTKLHGKKLVLGFRGGRTNHCCSLQFKRATARVVQCNVQGGPKNDLMPEVYTMV